MDRYRQPNRSYPSLTRLCVAQITLPEKAVAAAKEAGKAADVFYCLALLEEVCTSRYREYMYIYIWLDLDAELLVPPPVCRLLLPSAARGGIQIYMYMYTYIYIWLYLDAEVLFPPPVLSSGLCSSAADRSRRWTSYTAWRASIRYIV